MPSIITTLTIAGEKEYKQAVSAISSELRNLNAQLDLVDAQYRDNANSVEAIAAKEEALTRVLEAHRRQVEANERGYQNARSALEAFQSRTEELARAQEQANAALNAYDGDKASDEYKELENALTRATVAVNDNQAAIDKTQKSLNTWETNVAKAKTNLENTANALDNVGKKSQTAAEGIGAIASAIVAAGINRTFAEVRDALTAAVDASVSFESALAGVSKTTNLTGDDLAAFGAEIKDLSTTIPATANEIAAVAEIAAQLGVTQDNLLDFTKTVIAIGTATNISAEEAAASLAKIANITKTSADDYDRLGSVIVALGNNYATTERDIVSMATRLASTGELVGLTEAEIFALSTTLSSVGIEAEAGGSSIAKLLKEFELLAVNGGANLEKVAEISGIAAEDFATAWSTRPTAVIADFIEGLGKISTSGGSVVATLGELGITEVRMSNAVAAMASSGDLLSRALETANAAWAENTALAQEAAIRYETTESKMAMLDNSVNNLRIAIGDRLNPAIRDAAEVGTNLAQWATRMVEECDWLVPAISAVTAVLGTLLGGVAAVNTMINIVIPAFKAFAAALAAHPVFLAATAITALVTAIAAIEMTRPKSETEQLIDAIIDLDKKTRQSENSIKELNASLTREYDDVAALVPKLAELSEKTERTAGEQSLMESIIGRLNSSVPNLGLAFDDLSGSLNLTTERILELARAEQHSAMLSAQSERYVTAEIARNELQQQLIETQRSRRAAELEMSALENSGLIGSDEYKAALKQYSDANRAINVINESLSEQNNIMSDAQTQMEKAQDDLKDYHAEQARLAEQSRIANAWTQKNTQDAVRASETVAAAERVRTENAVKDAETRELAAAEEARTVEDAEKAKVKAVEDAENAKVAAYKRRMLEIGWQHKNGITSEREYAEELQQLYKDVFNNTTDLELAMKINDTYTTLASKQINAVYAEIRSEYEQYEGELDEQMKAAQEKLNELAKQEESFRARLQSITYTETVETTNSRGEKVKKTQLVNLSEEFAALEKYGQTIRALRDAGIPPALLAEMLTMGRDAATEYGTELLKRGEAGLQSYFEEFQQFRNKVEEIAQEVYGGDIAQARNELEPLERAREEMARAMEDYSVVVAKKLEELENAGYTAGGALGRGIYAGFEDESLSLLGGIEKFSDEAINRVRAMVDQVTYAPIGDLMGTMATSKNAQTQTTDIVNAVGTLLAGTGQAQPTSLTVIAQLPDGTELARALLPDIRAADRQSPDIRGT